MKFIAVLFLIANSAFAHVEPGTYKGLKADGTECSMTAGQQYFLDGKPHPLNERIPVTVGAVSFAVGHPHIIDSKNGSVSFNHDLFQGVAATPTGAVAVEIEMVHSADFEGPRSFIVMESFWREKRSVSYKCGSIALVTK